MATLVAAVRSGRWLVTFPTDTVPALAVRPDQAQLIFAAKQRSQTKPLILMGATPETLWPFVSGSAAEWQIWQQVAETYWPGALTLVLPASQSLPSGIDPMQTSTIGLRVPNWTVAQTILQQTGPLATTSVNLSGQPPLQTIEAIERQFPKVLTLLPSDWTLPNIDPTKPDGILARSVPSTVAKWTGTGWQVLRQGLVKLEY